MTKSRSFAWVAMMAWRDGQKSRLRLFAYLSATVIGIAALVAAGSIRESLREAIRVNSKPLLGADLIVNNRRPFTAEEEAYFKTLPFPQIHETRMTTMAHFPKPDSGRLMEVRAVDPGFPFYGDVKTTPTGTFSTIFAEPSVFIEENVMAEFGLEPGDTVLLGNKPFKIKGSLQLIPGEAVASVFTAPRLFAARTFLEDTGLLKKESLSRHRLYFKIPSDEEREKLVADLKTMADKSGWRVETVEDRQRSLGRQARNAERFLDLSALIMLVLGGIGVASIMQVYARDKRVIAATLKCLGAPATPVMSIFMLQGMTIGVIGAAIGGFLGIAFHKALLQLLTRFVTVEIPYSLSWSALASGGVVGFLVSGLFTLLPLFPLRTISPLSAFRFDAGDRPLHKDPAVWFCAAAIGLVLFLFSWRQMPNPWAAALVPIGIFGSLLILAGLTRLALQALRKRMSASFPYVWRQGLASLFRPNNQTYLLVPIIGLGTSLLFIVSFLHSSLVGHLAFTNLQQEPNVALFDIQRDQLTGVKQAVEAQGKAVLEEAPIVGMRLERIKDQSVVDLRKNPDTKIPRWALNRDYRSTYRDRLVSTEESIAGRWPPAPFKSGDRIPISLEEEIAENLGVGIGDPLDFTIQGVSIQTTVANLRKVDWFQLRPNFFAVFPNGVLEEAPQFFVVMTKTNSPEESARIQREIRLKFSNVSTLDLRLVLTTLDDYFSKVSFALRFMGIFVVATGILVLLGALLCTRYERIREAALLRTLGASRNEIRSIHLIEYGLIGFFSGLAGLGLSVAASWALAELLFEIRFDPKLFVAPLGLMLVVVTTSLTGFLIGRGMLHNPPLETLRED